MYFVITKHYCFAAVQLPYIYELSDTNDQSHFEYIHIQTTNTH